ncbi:Aspartate aminotransferase [Desulfosporosinus sp. I2]|uniref:hypothetical protein n=1 Tax=Desulfosporosinus sp. I2 TaxID=1617025 RepID=UPI0005EFCB11|nr:hypothetical protein [Desulfosporosinus sp. I2]KJR45083.1 Aspartate aminotransferase [Desulfosporosinus sp. I2]
MNCDFNEIIDRRQTGCVKWDFNQRVFGREDILPLWVADMDFKAPQAVVEPKDLQEFLVHKAGVGLNAGYLFGPGGEGFARINIACSLEVLEEGLRRIKAAVKELD